MKPRFKSITVEQLRDIVVDYAAKFPEWSLLEDGIGFVRSSGPIHQMIWFQKMNYAAYRPTHVVKTSTLAMPRMLHQILDVKNRETEYRLHTQKYLSVVAAMERQFKPDIRKPLDIAEVLTLCRAEARPDATNDLAMLAVLYAWLGQTAEALAACEKMQHCPLPAMAPLPEWEEAMRGFGRELADAVSRGNGRAFLERQIGKLR